MQLTRRSFTTPIGMLIALADQESIYFLAFDGMPRSDETYHKIVAQYHAAVIDASTPVLDMLDVQLQEYFAGQRRQFSVQCRLKGPAFWERTWQSLQQVPFGVRRSYADLALMAGHPTAHRAVAQANAHNPIVLLIPCHRIIKSGGALGGYASGCERKQWLLDHEKQVVLKIC